MGIFSLNNIETRSMLGVSMDMFTLQLSNADWMFIDLVISKNPKWTHFVELGTYYGLTSLYLGICALLRHGSVTTFDVGNFRQDKIVKAWLPNIEFVILDVLSGEQPRVIEEVSQPNTFVFFDNGDKVREVNMYAKYMQIGSGFVVHDHIVQWNKQDILPGLSGFKPLMNEVALWQMGSSCQCYVREQ